MHTYLHKLKISFLVHILTFCSFFVMLVTLLSNANGSSYFVYTPIEQSD